MMLPGDRLLAQLWDQRKRCRIQMEISLRFHVYPHADCPILDPFPTRVSKVSTIEPDSITASLNTFSRWLIANHRRTDAIDILKKLRGDLNEDDPLLVEEIAQLDAIVADSGHKRNSYINIFLGGRHSGSLHLGRRALMGAALQTIQQWTGILAIVSIWPVYKYYLLTSTGYVGVAAFCSCWFRSLQVELACWSDQYLWHFRDGFSGPCYRSIGTKEILAFILRHTRHLAFPGRCVHQDISGSSTE